MLSAPAPSDGATVLLSSSNSTVLRVPESVFVPAGHRSAFFLANTSHVKATTIVKVTAKLGESQRSCTVKVIPRRCLW